MAVTMEDQEEQLERLFPMSTDEVIQELLPNKSEQERKEIVSILEHLMGCFIRITMQCPNGAKRPIPSDVAEALIKCGLLYEEHPLRSTKAAVKWMKSGLFCKWRLPGLDAVELGDLEEQEKREISVAAPLSRICNKSFDDYAEFFIRLVPNPKYDFKLQRPSKYEEYNRYARMSFYDKGATADPRNLVFLILIAEEDYLNSAIGGLMYEMQELFRQQIWRGFAVGLVKGHDSGGEDILLFFKFVRSTFEPVAYRRRFLYDAKAMRTVAKILCADRGILGMS